MISSGGPPKITNIEDHPLIPKSEIAESDPHVAYETQYTDAKKINVLDTM